MAFNAWDEDRPTLRESGPLHTGQASLDQGPKLGGRWRRLGRRILLVGAVMAALTVIVVAATRHEPAALREQRAWLEEAGPEGVRTVADEVEARIYLTLGLARDARDTAAGPFSRMPGGRLAPTQPRAQPEDAAASTPQPAIARQPEVGRYVVHVPKRQPNAQPITQHRLQAAQPTIPRKIRLTARDVNAWMNERFAQWMEERGYVKPEQLDAPVFALHRGEMVMSFELRSDYGFTQRFNGRFSVKINDDGLALLKLDSLRAGAVPLPTRQMAAFVEETSQARKWLDKLDQIEFKPVMRLEGRLRVWITDYQIQGEELELNLRLEDRNKTAPYHPIGSRPASIASVPLTSGD